MVDNVALEFHRCFCCGRRISVAYRFCVGCWKKRDKVYNDCIAGGMMGSEARHRVEAVYPQKFS